MSKATPPNWPIYGLRLSEVQIQQCVKQAFPDSKLVNWAELGQQQSYNNRIYFLDVYHPPTQHELSGQVVLKVIGRHFGASKVQNEVACLFLLAKYCPAVPAPRVVAWSEDGSQGRAIRNGVFSVLDNEAVDGSCEHPLQHGWVMLSRLPGVPLTKYDLSTTDEGLVRQIADLLNTWRTQIPPRPVIGNLGLQPAGHTSSNDLHGLENMVSGLLLCGSQPEQPLRNLYQYYDHLLHDQIEKLKKNDVFAGMRPMILDRVEQFHVRILPHLRCLRGLRNDGTEPARNIAVFTHQDFAPRNILVTKVSGKLSVTGVLDFEFAGFFPETKEYIVCMSRQKSDWGGLFASNILPVLTEQGLPNPSHDFDTSNFDSLRRLDNLIDSIAPWQLESGHMEGDDLDKAIEGAKSVVIRLLGEFEDEERQHHT
ncbi:hypothetical protein OHC33_011038 [Knufia fluminis]|uniref:Aminoglycoside phosphotransferase domain-containing protein n=1 Tax=Knufia fluminis TaxID=191047 RepID=A0AAN8ECB1_9EURO|nr:hypothetical protein OHC33_011038 [Knufia fluminis]